MPIGDSSSVRPWPIGRSWAMRSCRAESSKSEVTTPSTLSPSMIGMAMVVSISVLPPTS